MEQTKMELFTKESEYQLVVKTAKDLGIQYVGVKKPVLIDMLNAKIEQINNGEVTAPVAEVEVPETNDEAPVAEQTNVDQNETPSPAKAAAEKAAKAKEPRVARVKSPKWYEGAEIPFKEGDTIEIIDGKILVGRKAVVVKPSSKKNALKAHLIHPTTGKLQNTLITIDFDKIKLAEDVPAEEPANEFPVAEAAPMEEIKAEQEQVDIPEMDQEQEELKAE